MATGDKEFDAYYKVVVKSSDVTLVSELKKAFTHPKSWAIIDAYGRDEILDLVIVCRRGGGSTDPIKSVIDATADALVKYQTGDKVIPQAPAASVASQSGAAASMAGPTSVVAGPIPPTGSDPRTTADITDQFNSLGAILMQMHHSAQQQTERLADRQAERDAHLQLELSKQTERLADRQAERDAHLQLELSKQQSAAAEQSVVVQRLAEQQAVRDAQLQLEIIRLKQQSEERAEALAEKEREREDIAVKREIAMLAELKKSLVLDTKEVMGQIQRAETDRVTDAMRMQANEARQADRDRRDSKPERISRAQRQIKDIILPMSDNGSELGFFFSSLTKHFDTFDIGIDIRHIIAQQFLSKKAKLLLDRIPPTETDSFDKLKTALLKLYNVTPTQYKTNFENATKFKNDSWSQFNHRLNLLLKSYLDSRQCDSFEKLCDVICSDKLIKCMEKDAAEFVRLKLIDNPKLNGGEVAALADSFCEPEVRQTYAKFNKWNRGGANFFSEGGETQSESHDNTGGEESTRSFKPPPKPDENFENKPFFKTREKGEQNHQKQGKNGAKAEPTNIGGEMRCWNCNSPGHKRHNCPRLDQHNSDGGGDKRYHRVNRVQASDIELADPTPLRGVELVDPAVDVQLSRSCEQLRIGSAAVNRISAGLSSIKDFHTRWRTKAALLTGDKNVNVQIKLTDSGNIVNALIDSGTEISCMSIACVPGLNESNSLGHVMLGSVLDKEKCRADLHKLACRIADPGHLEKAIPFDVELLVAIPKFMDPDGPQMLLTVDDFEALAANNTISILDVPVYSTKQMQMYYCRPTGTERLVDDDISNFVAVNRMTLRSDTAAVVDNAPTDSATSTGDSAPGSTEDSHVTNETADSAPADLVACADSTPGSTEDSHVTNDIADNARIMHTLDSAGATLLNKTVDQADTMLVSSDKIKSFAEEQLSDKTLDMLRNKKGKNAQSIFYPKPHNLMYRRCKIGGQEVDQLVLPQGRRLEVIKFTHDGATSGHLAVKKTLQKISQVFYFPAMKNLVKKYVAGCPECQKRRRVTVRDKVPITPVIRPQSAFEHVQVDIVGPISRKSSRGHSYILVLVDASSRYPVAVPLKGLTAKEVCDKLMEIFCTMSFPVSIGCDNGTCFVSQLNQEFCQRLGISIFRISPMTSSANGLVERFNQTLENMLNHVLNSDKAGDWDILLPFLLFAYRSIPNETTGISPYQLVYGKVARTPLHTLHDSWVGSPRTEQRALTKPVSIYLEQLRERLKLASDIALDNCKTTQKRYTDNCNAGTQSKSFNVGDSVLALIADSSCKFISRWTGPGTVTMRISENSYNVAFNDGSVKHLHANKLRSFNPQVANIGVIFEGDEEFGEVDFYPNKPKENILQDDLDRFDALDLNHLSVTRQRQLRTLLRKFDRTFNDLPGVSSVGEHAINLVPDFKPKKLRAYRVPDKFETSCG